MANDLTVYVTGQGTVDGDQLNTFVQSCDSFADLRNFPGVTGLLIACRGQTTVDDGGQGLFWWSANLASPSDDNWTVIVPSGSIQGAWVRLTYGGLPNATFSNSGITVTAATKGEIVYGNGAISIPASATAGPGFYFFFSVLNQGTRTMSLQLSLNTDTLTPHDSINTTTLTVQEGNLGTVITNGIGNWYVTFQSLSADGTTIVDNGGVLSIAPAARQYQSQLITSTGPGTWTTPSTITTSTQFKMTLQGAGGGGGGAGATANYIGGSGGAGMTVETVFTGLSPSTSYSLSVGVAGTGGSSGANAGGVGGNTFIVVGATTVTAYGGQPGAAGSTTAQKIAAFTGGTPDGTLFNIIGAFGISPIGTGGGIARGGSCFFGPGGLTDLSGAASVGGSGYGYGSGGAGGFAAAAGTAEAGGAGSPGFILIEWVAP